MHTNLISRRGVALGRCAVAQSETVSLRKNPETKLLHTYIEDSSTFIIWRVLLFLIGLPFPVSLFVDFFVIFSTETEDIRCGFLTACVKKIDRLTKPGKGDLRKVSWKLSTETFHYVKQHRIQYRSVIELMSHSPIR